MIDLKSGLRRINKLGKLYIQRLHNMYLLMINGDSYVLMAYDINKKQTQYDQRSGGGNAS